MGPIVPDLLSESIPVDPQGCNQTVSAREGITNNESLGRLYPAWFYSCSVLFYPNPVE